MKSDEDRLFTAFRGGAFLADLNMRPVFNPKFWNQWKVVETGSSKKVVELTSMGG